MTEIKIIEKSTTFATEEFPYGRSATFTERVGDQVRTDRESIPFVVKFVKRHVSVEEEVEWIDYYHASAAYTDIMRWLNWGKCENIYEMIRDFNKIVADGDAWRMLGLRGYELSELLAYIEKLEMENAK